VPPRALPSSRDLFAAGVVAATAALLLIDVRHVDDWADGTLFAIAATACVAVFALGARGGRAAEGPEASRSALLLAALVLFTLALFHLVHLVTDRESAEDGVVWAAAAFSIVAAFTGVRYGSGACTLLAALGVGGVTLAFLGEVVDPVGERTYYWAFTIYVGAFLAAGAILRLLGEARHSTQLVNAAAVALSLFGVWLGVVFEIEFEDSQGQGLEREWESVLVTGSLAVLLFGLFSRERGPAWGGAVALAIALIAVSGEQDETPTLVGWPIFLLGAAVLLMAAAAVRARR
jgi:hypothetical protein